MVLPALSLARVLFLESTQSLVFVLLPSQCQQKGGVERRTRRRKREVEERVSNFTNMCFSCFSSSPSLGESQDSSVTHTIQHRVPIIWSKWHRSTTESPNTGCSTPLPSNCPPLLSSTFSSFLLFVWRRWTKCAPNCPLNYYVSIWILNNQMKWKLKSFVIDVHEINQCILLQDWCTISS